MSQTVILFKIFIFQAHVHLPKCGFLEAGSENPACTKLTFFYFNLKILR
jgi:hypothetical protein